MNKPKEYDDTNPLSIEQHGKKLIGKTFADVYYEDEYSNGIVSLRGDSDYEDKRRKGGLGQLIEEHHFHYKSNSNSASDFDKAGVELKVTPYKENKNGSYSAKERLSLTMIDYFSVVNETFYNSHMWQKSQLLLLVYYLYQKEIESRLDYRINYVQLFTPPEEDKNIIAQDFEKIVDKIKSGKAHELSEGDTLYLGAAPKARNSSDKRKQPFSSIPAGRRAFVYKQSYMTYVLNNYIIPSKETYESILDNQKEVDDFETYVVDKISRYYNYTVDELCSMLDVTYTSKPKNLETLLVYRMLGIKGNHAAEFAKANIVIKVIRINKNNKIKESMSFPAFKFKELIEEEWEDSVFGNYLRETRFLFVIYKNVYGKTYKLCGCQFWNMPYADLEKDVREVWERTRNIIRCGLEITAINGRRCSNLPKKSENAVCHVRPHATNANDTYELPDGRKYPKQCFWLNNSYILSQLNSEFFVQN